LKDDFGIGSIKLDFGFSKRKEKKKEKKKKNSVSLGNDFGFKPLNLDFGIDSPKDKPQIKEPQITSTKNDFGMIPLGNSGSKKLKTPKFSKPQKPQITELGKARLKYDRQAAENKARIEHGLEIKKNTAVEKTKPTLMSNIKRIQNKMAEKKAMKARGIPADYEQRIQEDKRKGEIEARANEAAIRFNKMESGKTAENISFEKASKMEQLTAKIKNKKRVRYRFTVTDKDGDGSKTFEESTLSMAQTRVANWRSLGKIVSPIQQVIF